VGQAAAAANGLRRRSGDAAASASEDVIGSHAETAVARDHPERDAIGVGRVRGDWVRPDRDSNAGPTA